MHTEPHFLYILFIEIRVGGALCVTLLPEGDAKEDTVGEADLLCKGVVASEDCDLILLSESPGKVLDSISPPPPPSQVSLSHFFACFDNMILSRSSFSLSWSILASRVSMFLFANMLPLLK